MTEKTKKGLARVEEIYEDRSKRAIELKEQGKKIIGYLCIYPVIEMLTALDMVPFRIFGDIREPITKADACLPTVVCPFLRSSLDLGLKGKYNFLEGTVMSHACEVCEKTAHIWKTYIEQKYTFFIDVPHTVHEAAQEHLKGLLEDFRKTLEAFTGKDLSNDKLIKAIKLHNEQRKLVREIYELRKPNPPLISGVETIKLIKSLMSVPVEEGNDILKEVLAELKNRKNAPQKKKVRLLLWGSIIDDASLIEVIENAGANLVMDDTCVGTRPYFDDVKLTADPLEGLAYHYLVDIKCPRTFRESEYGETSKNHMKDLTSRFGYLTDYARDWKVDGIILHSLRFCDIHAYEIPAIRDFLESKGIKSIYIEPDYTESALGPLRTRIEAFIETLV